MNNRYNKANPGQYVVFIAYNLCFVAVRGRDRMVFGIGTTYVISAYHH